MPASDQPHSTTANAEKPGAGEMAASTAPTQAPAAHKNRVRYGSDPSARRLNTARETINDAQYPARIQEATATEATPISRIRYVEMKPPNVNSTPDSKNSRSANTNTRGERRNCGILAIGSAWPCLGAGKRSAIANTPTPVQSPAAVASSGETESHASKAPIANGKNSAPNPKNTPSRLSAALLRLGSSCRSATRVFVAPFNAPPPMPSSTPATSNAGNAAARITITRAPATTRGPRASRGFMPNRSMAKPRTRLDASMAPFMNRNSVPISAVANCSRSAKDGRIAPSSAITMPNTNMPAYAAPLSSERRRASSCDIVDRRALEQLLRIFVENPQIVVLAHAGDIRRYKGVRLETFILQPGPRLGHQLHCDEHGSHRGTRGDLLGLADVDQGIFRWNAVVERYIRNVAEFFAAGMGRPGDSGVD